MKLNYDFMLISLTAIAVIAIIIMATLLPEKTRQIERNQNAIETLCLTHNATVLDISQDTKLISCLNQDNTISQYGYIWNWSKTQ